MQDNPIIQSLLDGKSKIEEQRKQVIAEYDRQIANFDKWIDKAKQETVLPDLPADLPLTTRIIDTLKLGQSFLSNPGIAGATGATGPQVSQALYKLKEGDKIKSVGEDRKSMVWGLPEWVDDKGNIKDKYKPRNK